MIFRPCVRGGLAVGLVLALAGPVHAVIKNVDEADDICPSTDDPCFISEEVEIDSGSTIDFGTREVRVIAGGEVNVGSGAVEFLCGGFRADVGDEVAIRARTAGQGGGLIGMEVRRRCSNDSGRTCLRDSQCVGGQCDVGDADVTINGRIAAQGSNNRGPGFIAITAAGDIAINGPVNLNFGGREDDGGVFLMESTDGAVSIGGKVEALGGADSTGGEVNLTAARDVSVDDTIDVTGGDFDGGSVDVDAGRDVLINADLLASSASGQGFGGTVTFVADRDLLLAPGVTISTGGHEDSESVCGDGGEQTYDAARNMILGDGALLQSNAPRPDCIGGLILIAAGGDLNAAATVEATAVGSDGGGGLIEVQVDGTAGFVGTAVLDVTGRGSGAGSIEIDAGVALVFNGTAEGTAGNDGSAALVSLSSFGDVSLGGRVSVAGTAPAGSLNGLVEVTGCEVTVETGAVIDNQGAGGENQFIGRERITVAVGATITADAAAGLNRFTHRTGTDPPVLGGVITPAPTVATDPQLAACSMCGDGAVDDGETCDDGNLVPGDGCNEVCQDEGCIADTPGYPAVALCDDGLDCTDDACDGDAHECTHAFSCNDGLDCTQDGCDLQTGECSHVANNGLCNDGNGCTTDICNVNSGCLNIDNTNPCNDGLDCTDDDECADGTCEGSSVCVEPEVCSVSTGQCEDPTGGLCGNSIIDLGEQCDDGDILWDTGEFCNATCFMLGCGDPDDSGSIVATDALITLNVAVSLTECDECVCNVDSSGGPTPVTASDALRVLNVAVGGDLELACPPCP